MRFLLPLLLISSTALAVPMDLTHQGRLFDSTGVPISAPADLTVSLYDAATGGTALWTTTLSSVDFEEGYFNITLEDVDAAAFEGDSLWLGIAVGSDDELSRIVVNSVPFAVRAGVADSIVGGLVDASEVQVGGQTVISADGFIDYAALSNVPDASDTLSELGCAGGEVAVVDDTGNWTCVDQADLAVNGSSLVGTVAISALPVGDSTDTVAAGDHTHSAADVGAVATTGGTIDGDLAITGAADAGSLQLTGTIGTCDTGAAGTFSLDRGHPVYCDGADWQRLATTAIPDGSTSARAGVSCASILGEYPDSTDGKYFLTGGSGPAFESFCDMANGGWTLVFKTLGGSDLMQYASPHWTGANATLAADSLDASAADARLMAYQRVPFSELRGCAANSGTKCMEHDFGGSGYPSALALFSSAEILLYPNPAADSNVQAAAEAYRDEFLNVFTPTGHKDCLPQELGFNVSSGDGNFTRWGFANNIPGQPCQVDVASDADGVIGWGINGQDAGETGAGFTNYFVNDPANGGQEASFDSWLWVR